MKKMKKLAALALAMAMVLSLMVMTAAAYGAEEHEHDETCCEETIMPRRPAARCLLCASPMDEIRVYRIGDDMYSDFECPVDGSTRTLRW